MFLREFADFLECWETSKKLGLTHETFLVLRHTCLALSDCAAFLLDVRLGFKYVLLGSLQSDAIESRFGWLRQMSGANYYVSMKQVIESDRKIRALSLLKFSCFLLNEIDEAIHSTVITSYLADESTADSIAEALSYKCWPLSSDANIIYYISGAIACSTVRTRKCDDCREVLVNSDQLEPLQLDTPLNYKDCWVV